MYAPESLTNPDKNCRSSSMMGYLDNEKNKKNKTEGKETPHEWQDQKRTEQKQRKHHEP